MSAGVGIRVIVHACAGIGAGTWECNHTCVHEGTGAGAGAGVCVGGRGCVCGGRYVVSVSGKCIWGGALAYRHHAY
jgi:hypothetical protein